MVYLCLSNVLLIFEHDQSHVMIGRFNIHIKHKKITFLLFYYLLQIGYYSHDEGNHLGMPEDDDPPGPAPRIDILRELAMVPVPAGGRDTQLEQFHEMQAKLDEEAGRLVQL